MNLGELGANLNSSNQASGVTLHGESMAPQPLNPMSKTFMSPPDSQGSNSGHAEGQYQGGSPTNREN